VTNDRSPEGGGVADEIGHVVVVVEVDVAEVDVVVLSEEAVPPDTSAPADVLIRTSASMAMTPTNAGGLHLRPRGLGVAEL
jgi:hypothetical protein